MKYYILIALLVAGLVLFGPTGIAQAQTDPFGGFVIVTIPCTGNYYPSYLMYIIPSGEHGVSFMVFNPGTILYDFANLFTFMVPGTPVLGDSVGGGIPCLVGSCPYCVNIGNGPYVVQLGAGE